MIVELSLNGVASYKKEVKISGLKKLNFFFGSNGSGKTTIGKLLDSLPKNSFEYLDQNFSECKAEGYTMDNHLIYVFNENFIKNNFRQTDKLGGIFTLDEKNDKLDQEIDILKEKVSTNTFRKNKLLTVFDKLEKEKIEIYNQKKFGILDVVWGEKDKYKKFYEFAPMWSGRKEAHYEQVKSIIDREQTENYDYDYLKKEYQNLHENQLARIEIEIESVFLLQFRRLENQLKCKLESKFTGNQNVEIAELVEKEKLHEWIEKGLQKIDLEADVIQKCPFCQEETISKELISQFQNYFDKQYNDKKEGLKELKNLYSRESRKIIDILHKLKPLDHEYIQNFTNQLEKHFSSQIKVIDRKLQHTYIAYDLKTISNFYNNIRKVLQKVKDNNNKYEQLSILQNNLFDKVLKAIAYNTEDDIKKYTEANNYYVQKLLKCKHLLLEVHRLDTSYKIQINKLKLKIVDTENARLQINKILKNSGFTGFTIEKSDDHNDKIPSYRIQREFKSQDIVFETLSEGEKNFIAFLYFYYKVVFSDNSRRKIVVVDDPISSLDSQSLYIVTTAIRQLCQKSKAEKKNFENSTIDQIFILTHNILFHNEVSYNQFNNLCADQSFYFVSKKNGVSSVSLPTIKSSIQNDYILLWRGLFQLRSSDNSLNVIIGNLMRRIIQSYLQFTMNDHKERKSYDLITDLTQRMIYDSFISQINKESHHFDPLGEFGFSTISGFDTIEKDILFEVFENIFSDIGGKEHFLAMKKAIA